MFRIHQLRFRIAYWLIPSLIQNAHVMAMAIMPTASEVISVRDRGAYVEAWKRVVGWTHVLDLEDK